MKNRDLTRIVFAIFLFFISNHSFSQNECFKIIGVDTELDLVTISNLTTDPQDLSAYRLCSLFNYTNSGIGANTTPVFGDIANIPPGNFVIVSWPVNDDAADMALYEPSGNFSDPSAMVDFMQYGSAGNGREPEAVIAGLWTAGDFVPSTGTLVWVGNCDNHTSASWFFPLGLDEINGNKVSLRQEIGSDQVNIQFDEAVKEDLTIQLLDLSGKLISEAFYANTSGSSFHLQLVGSSGVYVISLKVGDSITRTFKVIH